MKNDGIKRSAVFSECRTWRYTLKRTWDDLYNSESEMLLFVLLNPSKADEYDDDPTNRRGIGFAKKWGYGGVTFVNLFSVRSPEPRIIKESKDPIGPDNDMYIFSRAQNAGKIIVAWGACPYARGRDLEVLELLKGFDLYCLGKTAHNHPCHPLFLRGDTELEIYQEAIK